MPGKKALLSLNNSHVKVSCREGPEKKSDMPKGRVASKRRKKSHQRVVATPRRWGGKVIPHVPSFLLSALFSAGFQPLAGKAHVIAGASFHHSLYRILIHVRASNQIGHVPGPLIPSLPSPIPLLLFPAATRQQSRNQLASHVPFHVTKVDSHLIQLPVSNEGRGFFRQPCCFVEAACSSNFSDMLEWLWCW